MPPMTLFNTRVPAALHQNCVTDGSNSRRTFLVPAGSLTLDTTSQSPVDLARQLLDISTDLDSCSTISMGGEPPPNPSAGTTRLASLDARHRGPRS
jgi:hypothetical protein